MSNEELCEFLRGRGIDVSRFVNEKIDCCALLLMSEEILKLYLPAYGDRITAIAFSQSKAKDERDRPGNYLNALDELRSKWQRSRSTVRGFGKGFKVGNAYAKRTTRRVELGWMDYNTETKSFKQVRQRRGGGVRHLTIEKALSLTDVLKYALDTFFPDGKSQRGSVHDFEIQLKDFQGLSMNMSRTVSDVYDETKLKILRVYLYTRRKDRKGIGRSLKEEDHTTGDLASGDDDDDDEMLPECRFLREPQAARATSEHPAVNSSTTSHAADAKIQTPASSSSQAVQETDIETPSPTREPQAARATSEHPVVNSSNTSHAADAKIQTPASSSSQAVQKTDIETPSPTISFHSRHRLSLSKKVRRHTSEVGNYVYRSYVGLLHQDIITVSDDSENEDVETNAAHVPMQLRDILISLTSSINEEAASKFNINRRSVLDGARRAIRRKMFHPEYKISVKFTDDIGVSEGAIDAGGPTREFLRMVIRELQSSLIFEGPENERLLALNASALDDNLYHDAGVLIAMSVVHGGPPPTFMSDILYDSLTMGIHYAANRVSADHIGDTDLQADVKKIENSIDLEDLQRKMKDLSSLFSVAGCIRPVMSVNDKHGLVKDLAKFLVLERTSLALHQFSSGLETLNVLHWMKTQPEAMRELFLYQGASLTAEGIEALFLDIQFSEKGSNRREDEQRVIGFWRDFLLDLEDEPEEGNMGLKDLLTFATGTDSVPPLGFDPLPSITFLHGELYPKANTCGMVLQLPVFKEYEQFKSHMVFGICNSPGFGLA